MKLSTLALAFGLAASTALPSSAATLRFAFQGELKSLYLLGWTPGSFDSWNVFANLYRCRDDKGAAGSTNLGGYCNQQIDELTNKILVEVDKSKRDQMIKEAYTIAQEDWAYIPLHQQALAWGVSKKVKLAQRADNQILLYWFRKD
jgi:peptide/nickel transport system substrate-binding protein